HANRGYSLGGWEGEDAGSRGATRTSSAQERPTNEPRARRKSGVKHSLRSSAPSPGGAPSSVRLASSRLSARSAAAAASPSFVRSQRSGGSLSGRPFSDRSSGSRSD